MEGGGMNGFLLLDKPKGITSYGVVARVKKELNLQKCGHTGTLDPDATGLLVVALGDATKTIRLLNEQEKSYQATIVFGYDSNTLDAYGTITRDIPMQFDEMALKEALEILKEKEVQIPPMVSAIKVSGTKLYEYERKHQEVELPKRPVKIYDMKQIGSLKAINGHLEIEIQITCSKGFYVRSFARDLGQLLGGCAIIKELRRLSSGSFTIENAVPLQQISCARIYSMEEVFPFFHLEVNEFTARLAKNGVVLDERQIQTEEPFYVCYNQKIIALYEPIAQFKYKPVVIFK